MVRWLPIFLLINFLRYVVADLVPRSTEMELKKLHLGTMSYAVDSMDEVAHQLATAFGVPSVGGMLLSLYLSPLLLCGESSC